VKNLQTLVAGSSCGQSQHSQIGYSPVEVHSITHWAINRMWLVFII